jgi:asparagine synthase (glutamine-hydrolysing)
MCGIAGAVGAHLGSEPTAFVQTALEAQRHRGPDHRASTKLDLPGGEALLGHNRLSIIDLSEAGNQPMWDAEHRLCIVYNGEIYNYLELRSELMDLGHRFMTQSDTEVILEAFKEWGGAAFERLNGMFAFGLTDASDGRLWLVRDRFGVKPLYYLSRGEQLVFASTPGPIARAFGCAPNLEYAARGIHYWLYEDDGPISPYEGIQAVSAGHHVVACTGPGGLRVESQRWYDFSERVQLRREEIAGSSEPTLINDLQELLSSAVTIRLRADVPIGISLSGGLDSSAIAALVAEQHGKVIGFSLGRPDQPSSEGPLVARVAKRAGIDVHYTWPDATDGAAGFWHALEAQDAPFPGLSIVGQYLVFESAHRAGLKVLLGGQGSDEMLMGYRKFQLMLLQDAARNRRPRDLLRYATSAALMLAAEVGRASVYLRQRERYLRRGGLSSALRLPPPAPMDLRRGAGDSAADRQIADVLRLSLPTLLRYEDRNSMANSLETRLPYLDYRFAELASALPDAMKVRGGYGKWALREAMRRHVPAAIRTARFKRGFDVPQAQWVAAGLGTEIRAKLRQHTSSIAAWLPGGTRVDELFSDERLGSGATAMAEATTLLWLAERS